MHYQFEILAKTRANIIKVLNSLTIDQLNHIPKGFNNSVFWNGAHSLVSQQLLCYKRANAELRLPNDYIDKFRKGTAPTDIAKQADLDFLIDQLQQTHNYIIEDYENGIFKEYQHYETSYGVLLSSIEDAIAFNNTHEALHLGYMMAQKRVL